MYKTEVKIDGMMCGMCEAHINDCIRSRFKVKKTSASHAKGLCEIISEEKLDEAALRSAITALGYTVTDITVSEEEKKKGLFGFLHK